MVNLPLAVMDMCVYGRERSPIVSYFPYSTFSSAHSLLSLFSPSLFSLLPTCFSLEYSAHISVWNLTFSWKETTEPQWCYLWRLFKLSPNIWILIHSLNVPNAPHSWFSKLWFFEIRKSSRTGTHEVIPCSAEFRLLLLRDIKLHNRLNILQWLCFS